MADSGGQEQSGRKTSSEHVDEAETTDSSDLAERQEQLSDDVDAILDDIDAVLEENAEEFVKGYVQKGGQ
jgi:prokaryotic ubiquitin-like protein Pup